MLDDGRGSRWALHFRCPQIGFTTCKAVASVPTRGAGDIFEPVTVTHTIGGGIPVSLTDDPVQFVPPTVTASPPRYDLNGNLLSDGRWTAPRGRRRAGWVAWRI